MSNKDKVGERVGVRMLKKKLVWAVSACFYLAMLVLSLCTRRIYEAKLPTVEICYLEQKAFMENGKYAYLPAIPESFCNRPLYCIVVEEKNKEKCYRVKKIDNIVTGEKVDGYYAVKSGVSAYVPVIVNPEQDFTEGQEVLVENEEEIKW